MSGHYVTSSQLATRYQVSLRTIHRWIKNPPTGFPAPVLMNRRHLWPEQDVVDFERSLAASAKKAA